MITPVCPSVPCGNPPVPLPPPPAPPPSTGGAIVVEASDTIILTGDGTADNPLRAELAFPLRIDLASTSYDGLSDNDFQMVYSAVESFNFVNAESTGAVSPILSTVLNVTVNDADAGNITVDNGVFSFALSESILVNPGDVVKIINSGPIVFDYLAITIVGNVTP